MSEQRLIDSNADVYPYVTTWTCNCSEYGVQNVMAVDGISTLPEIDPETIPLVKELRKKIEELEDQNRRLAYENLTLRDDEMYFEKRFYESVVTYENAMNQLQKYIAEMDSNKSNRYVIVDAESMDLAMKLTKVTEERDALIKELKHVADETETCYGCKWIYCATNKCINCDSVTNNMWEWSGLTEDENEKEN